MSAVPAMASPLPRSSQIGVGFRGYHPNPSQIGVYLMHVGTDWRRVEMAHVAPPPSAVVMTSITNVDQW